MPEAGTSPVSLLPAEASRAQASAPEVPPSMASPGTAPAAAMPPNEMPANEMDATPSGLQTPTLRVARIADPSHQFVLDSAELNPHVQPELPTPAHALTAHTRPTPLLACTGPHFASGPARHAHGPPA